MTYLLDTNAISDLMRAAPRIENWMAGLDEDDRVGTCRIVRGEVLCRVGRDGPPVLGCPALRTRPGKGGDFYASVKLARQQRGLALDENDIWVAATALALGATLVSRDSDFAGIDGLPVVALA